MSFSTYPSNIHHLRYERKYVLENVPLFDIQQMVKLHPVSFREAFPLRQVNNVYFDTANFSAYRDNIMGIANRSKFRIRWYGNDFQTILNPRLEEKVKHGELGLKNVVKLKDTIWSGITKETSENVHIVNKNLHPVLVNSYKRFYYVSPDKKFRLTIDFDMQYGAYDEKRALMPYAYPEKTVLELKYDQADSKEADRISQYLPIRPTKHSKYVIGIQSSYG